jgi:hypothetical protein
MDELSNYSFLPWLRQGIANQISATSGVRATIPVDLQLNADKLEGGTDTITIPRQVQLYGPGDIIGIENRAVIRTEPRNWITNFEPNYLPFVEFYDEDFPWRYTPAAPDTTLHRLTPWITLLVLEEGVEFEEATNIQDRPLPFISVTDTAAFPNAAELWAWAHVHINRSVTASKDEITTNDTTAVLNRFQAILNEDADLAYSRLISPRKLKANSPYHAFVIPTFESGRLASLGLDPATAPSATHSSWAEYGGRTEGQLYPYYYRWYFRTGTLGDFEYLVRLLQPRIVDPRVGNRDMDVLAPGSNLPAIDDEDLNGVLKLGGALRAPTAPDYDDWDVLEGNPNAQHPFEIALANFINLADEYSDKIATDANADAGVTPTPPAEGEPPTEPVEEYDDPLITPPLYGRWHALTNRLLVDKDGSPLPNPENWVHELNLDPRYRVPAGFGTGVVQANQEKYMDAAWGQIGDVLEANQRIRAGQLAKGVSFMWHDLHIKPLYASQLDQAFYLTAPVTRRVVTQGFTVRHQLSESVIPNALVSAPMRRALRPGGRLMKKVTFNGQIKRGDLLTRVSTGQIDAVPPKPVPDDLPSPEAISDILLETGTGDQYPTWLIEFLRRYPWLVQAVLAAIGIVALLTLLLFWTVVCIPIGFALIFGLFQLYRYLQRVQREIKRLTAVRPESQTPEAVDALPKSPDFVLTFPGSTFNPKVGTTDSVEAVRFKTSLKDINTLLTISLQAGEVPPLKPINLNVVGTAVLNAINPQVVIPKRTWNGIFLPERIKAGLFIPIIETFVEAMAYPEFDTPMYKPLVDLSSELFLPNIQLIEQNSITLLKTNQKFIEAYMVGLNHEFARELLWREYPTDQRGSYFRQFWDVSSFFDADGTGQEALREKLRDIPELHRWSRFSALGAHDHRETDGAVEEEVVLVIRGELLKKYPTAVIYAHRAKWQITDGEIDNKKERQFLEASDLTPAQQANPLKHLIKTPLYEAKVDPDIYFFGFDLTVDEAQGDPGTESDDDPGWFFVIKERPGEPRFGLDIDKQPEINVWNDLSWEDVLPGVPSGFIGTNHDFDLDDPHDDTSLQEKYEQYDEDISITWKPNTNAAELAYILYQVPVLVGVHASEMLPPEEA